MTAPATIVFDLDGTLADTAGDIVGTLNTVLQGESLPPLPMERAKELIGSGARDLIAKGFAEEGRALDDAAMARLFASFLDIYGGRLADESRLFPDVEAALTALADEGHTLAVLTNKYEVHAVALLRILGIADRFAVIAGRDTYPVCKPDPEALRRTVEAAGGDARTVVMVGDSRTDYATGRAAGARVVLVPFGYTDEPVEGMGADAIAPDFAALPAVLRRVLDGTAAGTG